MSIKSSGYVKQVHFESKDGLRITADLYAIETPTEFLLLCHRSHFNRGEYAEIAPKLNALGFSCLAIDQRSGMNVLGFINKTSTLAKRKGLATGYLDAKQDIEAAIKYSYELNENRPIILIGSSYSASLALIIGEATDKVKAIVAFSPGEYLKKTSVADSIAGCTKSIFITSAKKEIDEARDITRYVDSKYVTRFEPDVEGFHGARALWANTKGNETYWEPFKTFVQNQ